MGRKSSLTTEQWLEVERRHLVDGESINALAIEFGVNESSIRRKIKPNKAESPNGDNPLKTLAKEKVRVEAESRQIAESISALPFAKQQIVTDLARKLTTISEHLGSAAEISAASAHRLSILSNQQLEKVDDVNPLGSAAHLQAAAALQKMANSAMEGGLNLLRANKDVVDRMNKPDGDGPLQLLVQSSDVDL